MLLSELTLRTSYHKGEHDIAEDFYLPCMHRANRYDRAVGYFRSTAFIIAWPALRKFAERRGVIRILCSQVLADEDIDALSKGYSARADAQISAIMLEEVRALLADPVIARPAKVLAALIARGTIDIQIAVLRASDTKAALGRIFHDKLGLFYDECNNCVMFKGSMNETWSGLSADGNLESVDIAASWMGARDLQRTRTEEAYFDRLWRHDYPNLLVRPFPEVARDELRRGGSADWGRDLDGLLSEPPGLADPRGRSLLPHQSAGLASWKANSRKGILSFATGSGKTFTAITAIREALQQREPVIVIVPDRVLFSQWHRELVETTTDIAPHILRAGAGNSRWRERLPLWTASGTEPRLILATVATAVSEDFRQGLGSMYPLLVADEVHRLGSEKNRRLLDDRLFGARLGLSATPERAGDPVGTAALLAFFDRILEPRYSLADAVRDGVLTRYFYRPHPVRLSVAESTEWRSYSSRIAELRARLSAGDPGPDIEMRLQRFLIARARVVKHAAAKVPLAVSVMTSDFAPGQRWIVYCEDLKQLTSVSAALIQAGIPNLPFHSEMEGDRDETLKWIERRGGVLVAIKCLDEGVDIPSITHALILASSRNPREFIQRRGRVLRRAPGKALAYIHDAIVLPPIIEQSDNDQANYDPLTLGELARAIEFAEHADNPASSADLRSIAAAVRIDWHELTEGVEQDEGD